ncbi:MOSC domain-containing protein [Pusillimonas sp. MFBS29]|uniref:MOSC N-terminal beta barrel domain-containing protein n=1 Tax=Pusillimonas sp. MFBS29 TaxID=2886690 RepID=UPI001D130686|nr:MOSC N-terminal beta barrel domain-containing protein [Pusillimonas sp. MFBS29]MCC2596945.1 MOSC domain-containing protein [Pusillimonas sp. MFBS29]
MTSLYFPVVACGGTAASAAEPYDKRWLVVDATGHWLSQSHSERLADIQVELRMGYLVLRAPGMLRLDIPLDVIEDDDSVRGVANIGTQQIDVVDEGELAAAWVTQFLGQPCKLVKVHPEAGRVLWPEL